MVTFVNTAKAYKKAQVLQDISLEIKKGELVALIGPSGCGKTTMLKMINGLEKPTGGDIFVDGKSVLSADLIALRRTMGYVIQQTGLFPHMTIEENIGIIPRLCRLSKEEIKTRTMALMEMVGMSPDQFLWRYPPQLSGGQMQRVGVARAFAMDPEIILMDEPFSALDPVTREQLQNEMLDIQSKEQKTIVFVTHDMDEAIKLADRICILNEGHVAQFDTPENILKKPANQFVKNFVGEHRIWSSPEYIRVCDIMLKTPVTAAPHTTVFRAMELMRKKRVDMLLIVDHDHTYLGHIRAVDIQNVQDMDSTLAPFIAPSPLSTTPYENLPTLLSTVDQSGVTTIPVLDEDNILVGLITKSSLVTTLSTQFIGVKKVGEQNV